MLVTFVLCAALPVKSDTREGQHRDTVQKCLEKNVPWSPKCFWTCGWYSTELRSRSWSSVMMKMKFGWLLSVLDCARVLYA